MSGKYNKLKMLASSLPVPALTAVTELDLALWWDNYADMHNAIEGIIATINLTSSAFLDEHLDELASVISPQWSSNAQELLAEKLSVAGLGANELLAVRSSGSDEDSDDYSYAGLFVTRLNISGLEAIQKAIEDVWSSNFGRAVLIERLRCNSLSRFGDMTIILQRMVSAVWAGVAFSHDPVSSEPICIIEAVQGYGESLVSGDSRGIRIQVDDDQVSPFIDEELRLLSLQIANLVKQVVTAENGNPTDIEWAYDAKQIWLLQARGITTVGRKLHIDMPICEAISLYDATDAEIEAFRPLPDFAQYFRSKRKPMTDFASKIGLPAATSLLIRANSAGLDKATADSIISHFQQPQQLLDLSTQVRQQVVDKSLIIQRLHELLGNNTSVFVLRDFIRGEGGLITHLLQQVGSECCVLCEWSSDGLLAINRGTASTVTFTITSDGKIQNCTDLNVIQNMTQHDRILLYKATLQAQKEFGCVQLEWVYDRNKLYIIDYSLIEINQYQFDCSNTRVISTGYANGIPVLVDASRDIEQLSIAACVSLTDIPTPQAMGILISNLYEKIRSHDAPVIVVSPRPYAALAPLVPYAAGFVFEQASTLCHLAILLREQGIPAIESLSLYQQALSSNSQRLILDSSI